MSMIAMTTRPTADHPPRPPGNNTWHDSLFNCFIQIYPSCILSFLCPCILLGQIAEAVHFAPCICICSAYGILILLFFIFLSAKYLEIVLIWGIAAVLILVVRQQVRRYSYLKNELLEDLSVSCCCSSCAIAQMARHIYRYRSRFDEFSCATDGRIGSHNISTVVPVAAPLPVAMASHNYQHVHYVQPQQHQLYQYQPQTQMRDAPATASPFIQQSYHYDNNGNLIPIAVAVAV